MVTADARAQRNLLPIADIDRARIAAAHRRTSLPELAVIAAGSARAETLRAEQVLARTELGDLTSKVGKLETEIEQVRTRAQRDQQRLDSGGAPVKDLTNLQHELQSLARRQDSLEDDLLELMEQAESAQARLDALDSALAEVNAELAAAGARRDAVMAELDVTETELAQQRTALAAHVPADLLATYDRIRSTGKVGAAELVGRRCGACQLELDRLALDALRAAQAEQVVRCDECGAIVVRPA